MFFLLILITLVTSLHIQYVQRGDYKTIVVFNPSTAAGVTFMYTNRTGNNVYLVGVVNGVANQVVCRQTVTTQIIVAPRGCNSNSDATATERSNCGQRSLRGLTDKWFLDPRSDVCLRGGTCLGVPYKYSDKRALTLDEIYVAGNDDFPLVAGLYVRSCVGPVCSIPAITRVDIKQPRLFVRTNLTSVQNGEYAIDTQASHVTSFVFWRLATTIQYTFSRVKIYFLGQLLYDMETSQAIRLSNLTMVGDAVYELSLDFRTAPRPLELATPVIPDSTTYYKNKVSPYYSTMACSLEVGKLRFENKRPIFGGIPEGVVRGGVPVFTNEFGVPIRINADAKYRDFEDGCERFYPQSDEFHGFGTNGFNGPVYSRYVPTQLTCFAPFPFPEKIIDIGTLEERAKQCHMLGGVVATDTFDVCSMDSWKTYCRLGWIYFDQRCWYKFDDEKQSSSKVPSGPDSEIICQGLHPSAISTYAITLWVSAWLQRFFVYWKFPGSTSRVLIHGNRCECYNGIDGVTSCKCDDPYFPMCSYHVKDDPIEWFDIALHPETLNILKNGQEGLQQGVTEFPCNCFAGSTGFHCESSTCVSPAEIAGSVNASLQTPVIKFFKKCYAYNRGVCNAGDVYACICNAGFGPAASLTDNLYVDTPCTCPALSAPGPSQPISINGITSDNTYGVCGYKARGSCFTEGWNQARCDCRYRWSLTRITEPQFEGKTCSCRVPHFIEGKLIVETTCNRHGTCCPSGERDDGTLGYCPDQYDGCLCDDGWSGISCTSRIPESSLLVHPFELVGGAIYARQMTRLPVYYVYLFDASPDANVTLYDTTDGLLVRPCVKIQLETWEVLANDFRNKWNCNGTRAWYISIGALSYHATRVEAVHDPYPICGAHVNLFSARFFDIPQFRGYGDNYEELQPFKFAAFGSTNGMCVCMAGYVGTFCNTAISGWRISELDATLTARTCGDSTFPKRGTEFEDKCACGTIGESILFTGDACACAIVNGEMCAGRGTCITPSFPEGYCSNDITDHMNDALITPYSGGPTQTSILRVNDMNNLGFSVLQVNNKLWAFYPGTNLSINGIVADVLTCMSFPHTTDASQYMPVPFTLSYPCPELQPHRVDPVFTYLASQCGDCFTYEWVTTLNLSAPWCIDNELPFNDDTTLACIKSISWAISEDDDESLEEGVYETSFFTCANATLLNPRRTLGYFSDRDCSDPIDRLIDDALALTTNYTAQCHDQPISAHHNTLGVGYGLFFNLTPGIDFTDTEWTSAHYNLIASVTNNLRVADYSPKSWDERAGSFANGVNFTLVYDSVLNPAINNIGIEIQTSSIVGGFIAYSSSGQVCIIYPNTLPISTPVRLPCACIGGCANITLFSEDPAAYLNTNVAGFHRHDINPLKTSLFVHGVFPAFSNPPGIQGSIKLPRDQPYLRQFYNSFLAPRRCSNNLQCSQFFTGATCTPDVTPTKSWLNGDQDVPSAIGIEGGCECQTETTGFYSHATFCASCVEGYGPDTPDDIRAMYAFNILIPGFVDKFDRCSLPIDPTSTRASKICGGRGYTRSSTFTYPRNFTLVAEKVIRWCRSITFSNGGWVYNLIDTDGVSDTISSYSNTSHVISAIHGRLYNDNGLITEDWTCNNLAGGYNSTILTRDNGNVFLISLRDAFSVWF